METTWMNVYVYVYVSDKQLFGTLTYVHLAPSLRVGDFWKSNFVIFP